MVIHRAVVVSSADSVHRVVADSAHLPGRTSAVLEADRRYFLTTLNQLRRLAHIDDDDRRRLIDQLRGRYVEAVDCNDRTAPDRHSPVVVLDRGAVTGVMRTRPPGRKATRSRARPPSVDAAPPAAEAGGPAADIGEFRAYAAVDSPRAVRSGETFTLSVGFSLEGDPDDLVVDPNAPPIVVFEVQAAGIGFSFPDGVRRTLRVERADPTKATTTFTVAVDQVGQDTDATLLVTFARRGVACGRAVRIIRVHVGAVPPPASEKAPQPVVDAPVIEAAQATGADLTVYILVGDGKLQWRISTRHRGVPLPPHNVETALREDDARIFAQDMLDRLDDGAGRDELWHRVQGMSKKVTALVPKEFFAAVRAVWGKVKNRLPTLLIFTDEPYLPWELIWVSTDGDRQASLYTADLPEAPIAMLWQVGRWPFKIDYSQDKGWRPLWPPETRLRVTGMAVVTGGYPPDDADGLPEATTESNDLAEAYQAVQLSDEAGLLTVLNNQVTDSNKAPIQPSVVHIAMHGQADDPSRPLDALLRPKSGEGVDVLDISERKLSEQVRPLVFLNACQVGASGRELNQYTGIPTALITDGCRACIAPLWTIDDAVAHRFAVEFYRRTLKERQPVGQALAQLRQEFHADQTAGPVTPLAYVYYGHPNLTLTE